MASCNHINSAISARETGLLIVRIGHLFSSFSGNYFSLLLHKSMKKELGDTLLIYGQLHPYISTLSAMRPRKTFKKTGFLVTRIGHLFSSFLGNYFTFLHWRYERKAWRCTANIWLAATIFFALSAMRPRRTFRKTGLLVTRIGHLFSSFSGDYFSLLLHQGMKKKLRDALLIYGLRLCALSPETPGFS